MPKLDLPEVRNSKPDMVWVTIPKEDLFDMMHEPIIINGKSFRAGERYHVSAELGGEIERLITNFARGQKKLLRPSPDTKALNAVGRYGVGRQSGGTYADPNDPAFAS